MIGYISGRGGDIVYIGWNEGRIVVSNLSIGERELRWAINRIRANQVMAWGRERELVRPP